LAVPAASLSCVEKSRPALVAVKLLSACKRSWPMHDTIDSVLFKCYSISDNDAEYIEQRLKERRALNMTRDEILRKLQENRETIRSLGVRRLGIFGSYASDEQTEASDMDFLVEFETKTFNNYMDLKLFLGNLFGRHVDLVISDAVKPRLRKPILEETVYAPGL